MNYSKFIKKIIFSSLAIISFLQDIFPFSAMGLGGKSRTSLSIFYAKFENLTGFQKKKTALVIELKQFFKQLFSISRSLVNELSYLEIDQNQLAS